MTTKDKQQQQQQATEPSATKNDGNPTRHDGSTDDNNDHKKDDVSPPHPLSLAQVFQTVVALIRDNAPSSSASSSSSSSAVPLSTADQLQLYGYYKHVTAGRAADNNNNNNMPRPSMFQVAAYAKYQAWWSCRDLTPEQAMRLYVQRVAATQSAGAIAQQAQQLLDQLEYPTTTCDDNNNNNNTMPSTVSKHETTLTRSSTVVHAATKASLSSSSSVSLAGRIRPLIPRGQLDISYTDLFFATWYTSRCLLLESTWLSSMFSHPSQQQRHYEQLLMDQWQNTCMSVPSSLSSPQPSSSAFPVVGLSVRTLLDLFLRTQQYPAGSQVLTCPPITVPAIRQVLDYHGLQLVPIDLIIQQQPAAATTATPDNDDSEHPCLVAVDCDAVERAITPQTVAILVVHVFGRITATDRDMKRLHDLSVKYGLTVWEDCAESFSGFPVMNHKQHEGCHHNHDQDDENSIHDTKPLPSSSDDSCCYIASPYGPAISFHSFGLIKTCTALGGGIALVKNRHVWESMQRLQVACYPTQSVWQYTFAVVKAWIIQILAHQPVLYGGMASLCERFHVDMDRLVTSLLRGFKSTTTGSHQQTLFSSHGDGAAAEIPDWIRRIRYRPSVPLLAMMHRRLVLQAKRRHGSVSTTVLERKRRCEQLNQLFLASTNDHLTNDHVVMSTPRFIQHPGHAYWLYPILVADDPNHVCRYLRQYGYDATRGASQLMCMSNAEQCPRAFRLMQQAVYLPISSPAFSETSIERLGHVLKNIRLNGTDGLVTKQRHPDAFFFFSHNTTAVFIFVAAFLLACTSALSFVALVMVAWSAAWIVATFLLAFFLAAQALRWSIASFFLESSDAFAKYSYMLNGNDNDHDQSDRVDPGFKFRLDSTMKVLTLSASTGEPRSVILTGATGFIGSMLLYDLLKHRNDLSIKCIYIVSRSKRGTSATERIDRLLRKPMFSFLSTNDQRTHVRVVEGDTTKDNLGITGEELAGILQDASITHIFHCAASVSFTQSLADAARANISSTLYAQRLTARLLCPRAQLVYLSTAFVHGRLSGSANQPLPEQLHSLAPYNAREIYKSMCGTQYYASKAMTDLGFPNTYTFSKCVAEHLLYQSDNVNTIIIRPSIVGPAMEQPVPGWSGSKPSTIVAAACLYFGYQWNLWSFGAQTVPCIPVDLLCRYILAKTLGAHPDTSVGLPCNEESVSSDDDFEKVSRCSSSDFGSSSSSNPSPTVAFQIHTAAWDTSSIAETQFTWRDYAGTITQTGTILGYFTRPTAYLGLLAAVRLVPNTGLMYHQFETLHILFVQKPFQLFQRIQKLLGLDISASEKLHLYLDLPLLFFPFMNNSFHFSSELVAPHEFNGLRYAFRCVAAAHTFMTTSSNLQKGKAGQVLDAVLIAGSRFQRNCSPDCWWASMQPRGGAATRLAAWCLTVLFRYSFSGVSVDVESLCTVCRRLKQENGHARIILAPTHRSLFDFLVLSYALFALPEAQIEIPFILAADDFEKLAVFGRIAKLLGAFFVKRGQGRTDPALINAIQDLPPQSVVEVFMEGTRSRDRRFVTPKTGFFRCIQSVGQDCCIVPITISYEYIPEQTSLSQAASGAVSHGLSTAGLFSWLLKATTGKLPMGRVHICAADPVLLVLDSSESLTTVVDRVQQRQMEQVRISYYHVSALAHVLNLEEQIIEDALGKLGCLFWPGIDEMEHLPLPGNRDETWTVALQAGPYLAPLLHSSHPDWSKWLYRLSHDGVGDETISHPSVSAVASSLSNEFSGAARCIDNAISELTRKGFRSPSAEHIVQMAWRYEHTPKILLNAAVAMKMKDSELKTVVSRTESLPTLDVIEYENEKPLYSGEALGYWGFFGSKFVVEVDRFGNPQVTLQGDRYHLKGKRLPKIIPFLEQETGSHVDLMKEAFTTQQPRKPIAACNLSSKDLALLEACVPKLSTDRDDRIRSGTGHSLEDIFAVRDGQLIRVPDVVVWPTSEEQVESVISLARDHQWCLIPIGGGTNVSRATSCPSLDVEPRPIISIDMKDMGRILSIDEEDGVAHVQAGITGRVLVEEMARRGYTIGHEPDSYEFSTLGGWIATKASGMKRNKYGNIEDIVMAVRVAGPDGLFVHGSDSDYPVWGRESVGLDLCNLMLGSEGCLGIITSAVIRIWPIASVRDHDSILLGAFDQGIAFVRDIARLGENAPASVRLLDNAHFRLGRALQPLEESTWGCFIQQSLGQVLLRLNHGSALDGTHVVCTTIMYEGRRDQIKEQKRLIRRLVQLHGGHHLGASVGKCGYDLTFMIAYLRDFALTYHCLGESFESFVPWSKIQHVVEAVRARIQKEHADRCLPGRPFVGCRVTQLYHEGACLYFYLCMNYSSVNEPSAVFSEMEHAARDEILQHSGSLSHHHGVGKLRSSFLHKMESAPWQKAKLAIKHAVDPDNIFGARNGPFALSFTSS